MCLNPNKASIKNQTNIIGPNILPIDAVPNCCAKNKAAIMPSTIYTIVESPMLLKKGICFNPSIADVTEIGGVIMPSANNDAPPMIAGNTSHFFCLRTKAYNEKIPPSPLLSAFKVRITYFTVVCSVSVHMIQDNPPKISSGEIILSLIIAFKT